MKQLTNEAFSPEESKKIYDNFLAIIGTRRDKLVKDHGPEAENVAYATAVNQVKRQAEKNTMEKEIEEGTCGYGIGGEIGPTPAGPDMLVKLKEMVKDALKKPMKESNAFIVAADAARDAGKKEFEFPKGSGKMHKVTLKKDIDIKEDIDVGHTDDEPGMLKADLYRIGKYAMELYKMVDKFDEMDSEVDFPHWWQSKITKSKGMLVSAKHYLDFEMKEPQIDAMVDVASEEGVIDEKKEPLKEYTDQNFSGKELIDSLRSPDMFGKQLFSDLFPNSVKSEGNAIQSLKVFDELQYPPNVFVAVGYQNFDADIDGANEKFQIHQSLYYNHNYDDERSPGVVKLSLYKKLGDGKEEEIGQILAKSSEVSKDMKNLDKTGDFVSENKIDEKFASKAQQKYLYATDKKAAEKLGSKITKKDYKKLPDKVAEAVFAKLRK